MENQKSPQPQVLPLSENLKASGREDSSLHLDTPVSDTTFIVKRTAERTTPEAGSVLNERFRLIRELGHGGMATVFLAEEVETGRQVAIKMMQTHLEGTARQRFTREFSTIASIKHPYCLEVYEYGESDAGPFFAMELFAGEPATALIGQSLPIVLKALYDIAEALDHIHSHRIIHRDIKPANILVRSLPDGSAFDVRLADFGLAKFANTASSLSGETGFLGTIAYCAPEQIMRDDLDHRCDIYSFGLVCYEVLTARYPYSDVRRNIQAIVARQLREVPPSIRASNGAVNTEIDAAVMQMLSKDASQRPRSTLQFRKAIAEFLKLTVEQSTSASADENRRLVGTFVARDQEKRTLDALLAENLLIDGQTADDWSDGLPAPVAILTGAAGLGKTTLLRQAARTALANGVRVYEGRCLEGNLAPFQPFGDIIRQLIIEKAHRQPDIRNSPRPQQSSTDAGSKHSDAERIEQIFQEYAPEILRIAPEVKGLLPGQAFAHSDNYQQSDHVLRAIAKFFSELARIQPICLLIEDLHWADNSSLSLLQYLANVTTAERRESVNSSDSAPRIFCCATARPERDYPVLQKLLAELRDKDLQRTIELAPFREEAVGCMAAALLGSVPEQIDETLAQYIAKQCFGNPFYIAQSIRELRKTGLIAFNSGRWRLIAEETGSMPESVRAALRERVKGLDPLPLRILSVAAVIGAVVDVDLLRDVVAHADQFEFLDALDLLLSRQILNETGQARKVAFAHDLIREAVIERQATSQHLQRLHELVARRLEQLLAEGKPVSNAKLAEHFLAAGIHEKSFHYLLTAGTEAVSAFAFHDGIALLEKASEIRNANYLSVDSYQLHLQLARAYAAVSNLIAAEGMYRESIRNAASSIDRAAALFGLGDTLSRRRQPDESLMIFREGLMEVRQPLHTNLLSTALDIVGGMAFAFLLPGSVQRKLRLSTRTPNERTLAIKILLAMKHVSMDISLLRYLQLSQIFFIRVHQSGQPEHIAMGHVTYATNFGLYGVPYLPFKYLSRAVAVANSSGNSELSSYTRTLAAAVRGMIANASASLMEAEEALAGFERFGESYSRTAMTHLVRHLCEYFGDAVRELKYADEELRMANLSDDWEKLTWAHYGRASALARSGRNIEARQAMDKSFETLGNQPSIMARPIAVFTDAFVRLQASENDLAFNAAILSQKLTEQSLGVFLVTAKAYPLAIEAGLGPDWHDPQLHSAIRSNKARMRKLWWIVWKTVAIGALFLVARAHGLRVRGRYAFVMGRRSKAIRLFNRAVVVAEQQGSPYELARTLLDRSLVNPESANEDRRVGFSMLKELNAVLPAAEQSVFDRLAGNE